MGEFYGGVGGGVVVLLLVTGHGDELLVTCLGTAC